MLDIAPSELMLVAVVALVVIGPKDLPRVMRVVGQWVGKARGMARHFRSGFDEMVRQAEIDEMQKKWAEENARIMAEHPATPAVSADDGLTYYEDPGAPAALPAPEAPAPAPAIADVPAAGGAAPPYHAPIAPATDNATDKA